MKFAVIIPARYESSRLPGKPLIELCGVPMVIRTYRQCVKAVPPELVFVATEDSRIRDVCVREGIQCLMTSTDCLTGTDRIAECAQYLDADIFINIQGDEPAFNPDDIKAILKTAAANPDKIINGYCEITEEELFRSPTIPKVVMRPDGNLLYMSRSPIPTNKKHQFVKSWRQVCAYAFPRKALETFSRSNGKTPLEEVEDIEILRFLELGLDVKMIEMSSNSVAVDTPEDIQRAEKAIKILGLA
ncbi:3-deoxy-manno-octulosonate cytidylyltransferase [Pseudomonas sp. GCM10022188]|uniref:3-deoxy-manno-octulosonate cytidylyltransferase n=1 Tax=Pseudomonas TaxID=286 RepID=UPI001E5CD22F|nr:3-deoxy-manno-octulosonate cytidylyltransferase [Pseudomonas oryzagri]MCC6076901.1 3-deoxy-manno-octulosonate cytidylyltransferase [Pseudomonas oryzagri]